MAVNVATLHALALPGGRTAAGRPAFGEVVRGHQDEVFGLALRILGNRENALDVANTVFLKAYRAYDRYDPNRPLRNWLLRITTNEAISAGRALTRERARHVSPEAAAEAVDRSAEPERHTIEGERRDLVREAVVGLPPLYRVPVVLRYFNELSVEEIAEVTGRPASTVGVQLMRGRTLLKQALGELSARGGIS